jgi:hypothetical protein
MTLAHDSRDSDFGETGVGRQSGFTGFSGIPVWAPAKGGI